jgi:hypothetical protein
LANGDDFSEEQWLMCVCEDVKGEEGAGVRMGVVAVNSRTGILVHDAFDDGEQRMELDTRLRQLKVGRSLRM